MPWKELNLMSLRKEFVVLALCEDSNIRLLCKRFGISRKTGYKWLVRYERLGGNGLSDQSRRPHHSPLRTPGEMESTVVALRDKHRSWGGRKINARLRRRGIINIPAPSTITDILRRHDRINPSESVKHTTWIRFERAHPNELWQMDFKGYFATDHGLCHPLTVLDDHSRYCVCLQACADETRETVREKLRGVFRQYGLPEQINFDNGPPWGTERGDYTMLAIWLIRLGIIISHSRPRHPQTNGKDERFHRSLKAEVLQNRFFRSMIETQKAFDEWRPLYNLERPHEALRMDVPAEHYQPSSRTYKEPLPPIEYAPGDTVRSITDTGHLLYQGAWYRIGKFVKNQKVAMRPTTQDGILEVFYCRQKIRTISLKTKKVYYPTCNPCPRTNVTYV
jgi:transposase InsO family protein